jgi:hypothetical protein
MSEANSSYQELLEKRIELLDSLASALLASRSAMAACDINGLEARIAQQQTVCAEIQSLDEQIKRLQYQSVAHLRLGGPEESVDGSPKLAVTLRRLHQAQEVVKQLNNAHQALVARSRRTVNALLNSLHSFEGNYRDAALQQAAKAHRNDEA